MDDERPRDVRDSLSELEQRLLELELELRADSLSDASAARQTTPGGRTHSPSPIETQPASSLLTAEAPDDTPATRIDTPIADEALLTVTARPVRQEAPSEQPAAPPGAPLAPPAEVPEAPPARPQPDVRPFVDDTRRKVDALRTSLDGLTVASDRLREVAQVVVEDHGRALVRLERANAARQAAAPTATLPALAT